MGQFAYRKLEEILVFSRGFDITKAQQTDGDYPVISSSGPSSYNGKYKCKGPGVVTGRKGTLGKVFFTEGDYWPHDTTLWVKDFKGNDPRYIYYLLTQLHFEVFDVGASNPTLNRNHVHKISVQFPSDLPTQQRIAGILSAYDELIEVNNQRIRLLEDTARQLYKEWFVRLRFPGHEQTHFVKGLPEGWEVGTCHKFADIRGGGTPATTNPAYWDGPIKFYTPTDYPDAFFCQQTEKSITETGFKKSSTKLFPQYTTFITARGTVGNVSMASEPMAMNQSCFGLIARKETDRFYLFLYTLEMVDFLKQVATGATFDAVTLKTFTNYPKPTPPEPVREQFSLLITPIFLQIETLQSQNTHLRQIRDRLLPRLISGKLSVQAAQTLEPHDLTQV